MAEGLQALRRALLEVPGVELAVIAPDSNRSAVGRGITTRRPLWVEEVDFGDGTLGYATDGTPVDCVRFAALGLIDGFEAELVVSGINHGANLGDDITYSGTVAAALEAIVLGLPGDRRLAAVRRRRARLPYRRGVRLHHGGAVRRAGGRGDRGGPASHRDAAQHQRPGGRRRRASRSPAWASASTATSSSSRTRRRRPPPVPDLRARHRLRGRGGHRPRGRRRSGASRSRRCTSTSPTAPAWTPSPCYDLAAAAAPAAQEVE